MTAHFRRPPRYGLAWLLPLALFAAATVHAATDSGASASGAPGNALEKVDYSVLPGNQLELRFHFSQPTKQPRSFTIQKPARIALDFAGTRNATGKQDIPLDVGVAQSVAIAQAGGRTRIVLNLTEVPKHRTRVDGKTVIVTLGGVPGNAGATETAKQSGGGEPFSAQSQAGPTRRTQSLDDVNFRRGENGEGRVILDLSSADVPVNIQREGGDVVVELQGTQIPKKLRKRLDVLDFATPVKYVDVTQHGDNGRIRIEPRTQDFEQLAYQSDDKVTVELKPLTREEAAKKEKKKPKYTGKKLSLNFQDIEVRSVLQLLADFTGLNIVVSDSVTGNLTLRLKNVPWDQALDIILRSKGLAKRRNGNVIFVAPQQELAAREQAQLQSQKKQQALAPLQTEYIQVNYAKASDLADILKSKGSSLLSDRASVTVDQRTNTLLIRATSDNLDAARQMVNKLDVPVRQVLIESRIVVANNDFNQELGIRWGVHRDTTNNGRGAVLTNNGGQVTNLINNNPVSSDRYNVNLPTSGTPAGSVALALAKLPFGTLIELELSALQAEGRGEIVSTPRVITANQKEANIQQGVEVPYQEASSSGATSVSFKKAVLSLGVTPQITPDDRIIMDLKVTNDTVGQVYSGVPSIDTRELQTQVLVDNGETVVLGGIYEQTKNHSTRRVPFFGDLPIVGSLFRSTQSTNNKRELLVFVTPKIVKGKNGAKY